MSALAGSTTTSSTYKDSRRAILTAATLSRDGACSSEPRGSFQSHYVYRRPNFGPGNFGAPRPPGHHLSHGTYQSSHAWRTPTSSRWPSPRLPQSSSSSTAGANQTPETGVPGFSFRALEAQLQLDTVKSAAELGFTDTEAYTAPGDLSQKDLLAYQQSDVEMFEIGSIPLDSPPKSLCT
ncbi:unnamed protein product [Echinostoma caproni]|uniref:TORC_N domain-containing protein n=1 Tax=Echinostoma caproni TaxID=27848 RepID=A0A183AJN2_9TREM|nr:unnamed protein product [Echinostoma caproni]